MQRRMFGWSALFQHIVGSDPWQQFLLLKIDGTGIASTVYAKIDLTQMPAHSSEAVVTASIAGKEPCQLNITPSAFEPGGWTIWVLDPDDLPDGVFFPRERQPRGLM